MTVLILPIVILPARPISIAPSVASWVISLRATPPKVVEPVTPLLFCQIDAFCMLHC